VTLRIVAVTRKPHSASFEQRVQGYLPGLRREGIEVTCRTLPKPQREQRRAIDALDGFDAVWWHRSLVLPWHAARLRGRARRLVVDFDDPLPYSARGGGRRSLARRIRFAALLKRCDAAIVGSGYLADLARPYCRRVELLPMAVDVPEAPIARPSKPGGHVELLWVGSRATQPYLEIIRPALEAIGRERPGVRLRLVAHEPARFDPLPVDFRRWSPEEQAAALRECDVGLCPMPDTLWTRGKCPFKTLQYMAAGMAWAGSAVGENVAFAGDGAAARGLCATDEASWRDVLGRLADDADRRAELGRRGHAHVAAHHARDVLASRLAALWRDLAGGP
jgi:glycosyltransferase involved in cell wall biosynthesis